MGGLPLFDVSPKVGRRSAHHAGSPGNEPGHSFRFHLTFMMSKALTFWPSTLIV
jgi:hypothetical protein